jgi:hypothetical protein
VWVSIGITAHLPDILGGADDFRRLDGLSTLPTLPGSDNDGSRLIVGLGNGKFPTAIRAPHLHLFGFGHTGNYSRFPPTLIIFTGDTGGIP